MILNWMNAMCPNQGFNLLNYNLNNDVMNYNLMLTWMNMYPNLFMIYQNAIYQSNNNNYYPSYQAGNQNNINNNNNTTLNIAYNDNSPKINLVFVAQRGTKMNVICSYNTELKTIFSEYIKRLGLDPKLNNSGILFLYNGANYSPNDGRRVQDLNMKSGDRIVVIDTKYILGASF